MLLLALLSRTLRQLQNRNSVNDAVALEPAHMIKSRYRDIAPYITRDGSEIRELMHPAVHGNVNQSLAEATVLPGQRTQRHRHHLTEEIYHITAGHGRMQLGNESFTVTIGDTILIPPGTAHAIENTGTEPLRILCSCSPAYSHEDTELLDRSPTAAP
jgi:mannose-6-phosphate isomerase-like protein (cupin superfamily)